MNMLIRLFEQYGYLSPMCKEALEKNTQIFHKRKGEYLLKKGQLSGSLYVLEEGFVRGFYMHNDQEIDVWFAFEQTIMGSTYQMYKSKASLEFIQCMEDCVVHAIPNQVLFRFFKEYPELNLISRRSTEDYCLQLEDRAFQLQTMSATERYHRLLKDLGSDVNRIPLGNVASYLGISQETLSRIRRI
ncbi:Crp/Fnr family transcriptional regulator [Myroides marinus]|uniref:cAMP-binding domain of CRP or a regulatory subunit of cAMP-dependent protein kinases n=1 Tax=Myroides marinus TaxID=703342 RepID=A0A1H6WX98_9FLAO|nr:Crp/Fnr family transcriptional regulator [Myroides marinus]KUF44265.1 transcriptional regulator [Myroides marinus]MDM1346579.1 Crp/Fnr family transcriptional regulator [Myroides marinus]MDM1349984.1 Crp/Fnr family transcriptional regulator [Myroides marinus]MDM1353491.1 Crp/Fnr family transcriptional regulator [Myroides marinus]MDM1357191.1 Crp/Fnr family transcriptional regulator [Myroides marinus]